jgi:hypothetical protein
VALGHHLGPDEHRALGRAEGGQDVRAARDVRVEAQDGPPELLQAARELLGARAVPGDGDRRAVRAGPRDGLAVAAVVAGEHPAVAVQHEGHVAVRALPRAPAGAAGQEVRPAAAVEQDDRLARGGERLERPRVQRPRGRAHVDDLHGRHAQAVDPRGSRRRRRPCTDSGRGVAEPATSTAPARQARHAATARAS